jgi:hypothetical protein
MCSCSAVLGSWRRASLPLPLPRAFESMVLEIILNDFVPRSDWFGDVVALAARC